MYTRQNSHNCLYIDCFVLSSSVVKQGLMCVEMLLLCRPTFVVEQIGMFMCMYREADVNSTRSVWEILAATRVDGG